MNHSSSKHDVDNKGVINQSNKLQLSTAYSKNESEQIRIYNGQIEALTNKLKMLESFHFH